MAAQKNTAPHDVGLKGKIRIDTLIDTVKAMEKASTLEIAARVKMDVRDVFECLKEHEERKEVYQVNGYWQIAAPIAAGITEIPQVTWTEIVAMELPKRKVSECDLIQILSKNGPMTPKDLSMLTGGGTREILRILTTATSKGLLVRKNINRKFHYETPKAKNAPEQPVTNSECLPMGEPESMADDFTARDSGGFLGCQDELSGCNGFTGINFEHGSMSIPTPKALENEIRLTRNRLRVLERCHVAATEIYKSRHVLTNIKQLNPSEA